MAAFQRAVGRSTLRRRIEPTIQRACYHRFAPRARDQLLPTGLLAPTRAALVPLSGAKIFVLRSDLAHRTGRATPSGNPEQDTWSVRPGPASPWVVPQRDKFSTTSGPHKSSGSPVARRSMLPRPSGERRPFCPQRTPRRPCKLLPPRWPRGRLAFSAGRGSPVAMPTSAQ